MGNHLAKTARGSLAALVVLSLAMNSLRAEPIYTVTDQGVVPDSVLDEGHSPMDVLTQRRLTIDDKGVIQAKNWDLPSDYAGPLPENMTQGGNPPSAVATSRAGDNVAGWGFDQNHGWTGFADIDGYATSVGKLQGAHWSQALGINREGQVVGMSGGDRPQAFLYTRDQGIKPIGPAGTPSAAYAINDSGQVVGEMAAPTGSKPAQGGVSTSSTASSTAPSGAPSAIPANTASQVMTPPSQTSSPSATGSASQVQVTPGTSSAPGTSQVPTTSPSTASTQTVTSNSSPATTSQATGAGNPGVAPQVMAQSASGSTSATTSTSPSTGSTSTGTSNAGHTASGSSGGVGQTPSTLSTATTTSTSAPSSANSAVTTTSPSATTGSVGAVSSPSSGTPGASATPTLASSSPTDSTTLAATTTTTAPQPGATTPTSTTSTATTGTSTTDASTTATNAATNSMTQTRAFTSFGTGPMLDLNRMIDYSLGLNLTRAMDINMYGQIAAFGVDPEGKTHSLLLTPNTTIDEATLAAAASQADQAELSSARLASSPLAVPEPSLVMFSLLVGVALVVRSAPQKLASRWSRLSR